MRLQSAVGLMAGLVAGMAASEQQPFFLHGDRDRDSSDSSAMEVINASPFLSFHRDLVQTESITGNEAQVGSLVAEFLESHGFTVIKQAVYSTDASRFNVFAYPSSLGDRQPEILLTSHIDTVPPFIPYSVSHVDNDSSNNTKENIRIAGRGSVDAKASVAAQVFSLLEVLNSSSSSSSTPPLGLLFVTGEETGGDGMYAFSRSHDFNPSPSPYHTFIFGEPTEHALVDGHKGMLRFNVEARGKAAHSGYPWLGRSAISAILPALERINLLGETIPAKDGGLPSSDKFGNSTVNIGRVDAGVATNVVPASATAEIAVRLAAGSPDEAADLVRRAIRDALSVRDSDGDSDRHDVEVYAEFDSFEGNYPPQNIDADVEGFDVVTVNYGTDVPHLTLQPHRDGKQVKRYLYGPGSIFVAHGDNEALTVAELERAVVGYRMLIEAALRR